MTRADAVVGRRCRPDESRCWPATIARIASIALALTAAIAVGRGDRSAHEAVGAGALTDGGPHPRRAGPCSGTSRRNSGMAFSRAQGIGPFIGDRRPGHRRSCWLAWQPALTSRLSPVSRSVSSPAERLGNLADRMFREDELAARGRSSTSSTSSGSRSSTSPTWRSTIGGRCSLTCCQSLGIDEHGRRHDPRRRSAPALRRRATRPRRSALVTDASRADAAALVAAGGSPMVDGRSARRGKVRLQLGPESSTSTRQRCRNGLPPAPIPSVEFDCRPRRRARDRGRQAGRPASCTPGTATRRERSSTGCCRRYPDVADVGEPDAAGHRPSPRRRHSGPDGGRPHRPGAISRWSARSPASTSRRALPHARVGPPRKPPNGVIDAPIGRDHRDPMRMAVVVDGKSGPRTGTGAVRATTTPARAPSS